MAATAGNYAEQITGNTLEDNQSFQTRGIVRRSA